MKKSKSRKPVIGILPNIEIMDSQPFLGLEKTSLHQTYINSISKAGGIPVILPMVEDKASLEQQIGMVDGLLLSGGADIHPFLYGEDAHPDLGYVHLERDRFEIDSLLCAYKRKIPILGICRGIQLINVAFGGTLYQDLSHGDRSKKIKHSQEAKIYVPVHSVEIESDTLLHKIFGKRKLETNSFHHQAVRKVASGFIVSAVAKDGTIEGIEKPDYPFLVGVQWHPERMVGHHQDAVNLFEAFIKESCCVPRH